MAFGYTPFDPLVVVAGTLLALWYLHKDAVKLIGFMPTALSLWFFIPFATNLTLWQIVPLLLTGRMIFKGKVVFPSFAQAVLVPLFFCFALSASYALLAGSDLIRVLIRIVYYIGVFATLSFAYEMGRKHEAYEIFLKGLVAMGVIYAAYGAYQIIAFYWGLPLRGIVYSASGASVMVTEAGVPRINSLANEPKRLGYILFLAALACIFLARMRSRQRVVQLRWAAVGIFLVSIVTFAGSYFGAIALFGFGVLFLYPYRASVLIAVATVVVVVITILLPNTGFVEAIQHANESRIAELQVGLDGVKVYRQEFFAWEYLENGFLSALIGVGIGQYYSVFNEIHGNIAGYNELGGLLPLNSNFLELIFDLGGLATFLLYAGLFILVWKLRSAGETFFSISLLFLVAQSVFILNLLYIAFFAGFAMGKLSIRRRIVFASTTGPRS